MTDYVDIGTGDDLRDGEMKKVILDGREILLTKVAGKYYALDDRCPHMGADLSQGTLEGTILTCPRHHSQFDVRDGRVIRWTDWTGFKLAIGKLLRSPRPAKTYQVRQEGESVAVGPESPRRAA